MKFGFACHYLSPEGHQLYPFRTTTKTSFLRDPTPERLYELSRHNLKSLLSILRAISTQEPHLRMFRIGSELLPLYTLPEATPIHREIFPDIARGFTLAGQIAREHNIRLSFHPGQYTVMASNRPEVIENSILDLEYHAFCATSMGYGTTFQDFKINIHANGAGGLSQFIKTYHRLSPELRSMLTV